MSIGELNPHLRLLLGPGPSPVHPRVLKAMSTNVVGHLDPDFLAVMDDCQVMLREVFGTKNRVTFPVSGTGSAGMEAAVCNVIEPGDKAIICVNGVFGTRMTDVAGRYGAEGIKGEAPRG
ncbi:MAG: alanine--glyoxylate aminotransferase family protein, partial [Nitrospinaceae bacterium]|nr:alanine--glyoxylate aminotransferase family protein [Nitrospinaceae bacterium]